jgi:hypothetical protein
MQMADSADEKILTISELKKAASAKLTKTTRGAGF